MKILASFSLLLVMFSVISAKHTSQVPATSNDVTAIPFYHHWKQTASDMETACATATNTTIGPYADPEDCMQFYFCTDVGIATPEFPIHCDDEYKCFDPNASPKKVCSTDSLACKIACAGNGPECKYECEPGIQIADKDDCKKHYFCDMNSIPIEFYCSDDTPHFNGRECVNDEAQCCKCHKRNCDGSTAGDLIEDTDDCHNFYACIEVSESGDLIPVGPTPCPTGESFNPDTKECDASNNGCTNLCDII